MTTEQNSATMLPEASRSAGPPAVLDMQTLSKRFADGTQALGGIDLTVREGEFVSLLGASGAGKSTLLRICAGLDSPTGGTLRRTGDVTRPGGTAMVFQDAALMPWASVFENVWLPLRLAGKARAAARDQVMHALDTVGLKERADALPRELSGGMKMRVSIARALITAPRLVLLDEPFAALDEITRFHLNDVLLELWERERLTVLFVTHSVFEAAFLSTRVAVLSAPPARIADEMAIPADLPRDDSYRQSAGFLDYARRLSAMLARAGDVRE